jgi:hypothetical protein
MAAQAENGNAKCESDGISNEVMRNGGSISIGGINIINNGWHGISMA